MDKLKLSTLPEDKPVKLTLELPAQVHRDLIAYAEVLGRDTSQIIEPAKLVAPMLPSSWGMIAHSEKLVEASPQTMKRQAAEKRRCGKATGRLE